MRTPLLPFLILLLFCSCQPKKKTETKDSSPPLPKATQLIHDMIASIGGADALERLKDVEYQYTYESFDGFADISTERYLFEGEYSWGRYTTHKNAVMTTTEGVITQGFDGQDAWVAVDGVLTEDTQAKGMSRFLRKTNFYWFCMNFKLLDPGVNHEYLGQRTANEMVYEVVKITFEPGVGTQDEFVLYINPQTLLVDQFLFTVRAFGQEAPLLMRVTYQEISGIKLPTYREYAPANWEGELTSEEGWTSQTSENIRFNNGFTAADFTKPGS